MDLDAIHKDVTGLKNFRAKAEEAITFYELLKKSGGAMPAGGTAIALSSDDLEKIVDQVVGKLGARLDDLDGRLKVQEQKAPPGAPDLTAITGRLDKLEAAPAQGALSPDLSDRLTAMLTWFDANQEGLEVLLSLDGQVDPNGLPATGGTPAPGSVDGTGAAAGAAGTDAAPGTAPAPASPGTDPAAPAA